MNIKKISNHFILLISLLLCFQSIHAQSIEISIDDLTFHSEYEKECFFKLQNDSSTKSLFFLALAQDKNMTNEKAEKLYNSYLKSHEKILFNKINQDKPKTFNKYLYEVIHDTYLEKYSSTSTFVELLDSGFYNCVSSSILFALIFDKHQIPFKIKRLPEHVYLIAMPGSKFPVKVETTDPNGYILFNHALKDRYVKNLYEENIISERELNEFSAKELFNKYFFNDDDKSIKELISIEYFNFYSKENHKTTLLSAEKAYFLSPEKSMIPIIYSSLSLSLQGNNFETIEDIGLYTKAINYNLNTWSDRLKTDEFLRITQRFLFDEPNEDYYHEVYSYLMKNLNSEVWKNNLSGIYFSELCRKKLLSSSNLTEAMNFALNALAINPDNIEYQRLVYQSFQESIKSATPDLAYNELKKIFEKFPHLYNSKIFWELNINLILHKIQWAFQFEKPKIGIESISELEDIINHLPDSNLNPKMVTRAFSEAAIYYFRIGNKRKSIELLEKGLNYAPSSYELNNRLSQLRQ